MAGWRAGTTGAGLAVLLLALVHAAAATLQCPKGRARTLALELQADCAQGDTCCVFRQSSKTFACARGDECEGPNVCVPKDGQRCCPSWEESKVFGRTSFKSCVKVINCPRNDGFRTALDESALCVGPDEEDLCCGYHSDAGRYTCHSSEYCVASENKEICTPTAEGKQCCAKKDGSGGYVKPQTAEACGRPLSCPVEVAEDPFTVPCDTDQGSECCIIDGRRRAKCFRGAFCRTGEACQPKEGEKCCLDAAGEKMEVVNQTTVCPHRAFLLDWPPTPKPRCEDRGALKKAECGAGTLEEGAACARRVELCLEGEAVPAAEAAGKACDEAWAHCLHSHAKGPNAHPLLTAPLLLLLPN